MSKGIKRVLSMMLILQLVFSMFTFTFKVSAADTINRSRMLKVSGNKIVLEEDTNVVVRLTGLNIPGAEWTGSPDAERIKRSTKEALENWNANLIRLPVSVPGWYGDRSKYSWIYDGGAGYRKYIDEVIQIVSEAGKYVVLDLHHYTSFNNQLYLDFWTEAATKYKNNPTVLFGILNEPKSTTWAVWRNGDGNSVKGHQQVVEMIRDIGAKNIIIAGGLDWGYDLRGIVGKAPNDSTIYALIDQGSNSDLTKAGNGIMYDTHIYPWKGRTSNWDSRVGEVRKKHPILVGENGWDAGDILSISGKVYYPGDPMYYDQWVPELFSWMNDEETYGNLANWSGWCFHPLSSPKILADPDNFKNSDYAYTPTEYWGVYVKQQLKDDLGQNIVLNKTVTSSASDSGYSSTNTIDDNPTTLWVSSALGDKHITVDLGKDYEIKRWVVRHAGTKSYSSYNTKDFKLQVSNDQTTWTDVDSIIGNTNNITDRFVNPVTARYARLYVTQAAQTDNTMRIYEFSVYGEEVELDPGTPPVASVLQLIGRPNIGQWLTATYAYYDNDSDIESGSILKWIASDDPDFKTNVHIIKTEESATAQSTYTYDLTDSDRGKYIRFSVIPRNAANENNEGVEAISASTEIIGVLKVSTPMFIVDNEPVEAIDHTQQSIISGRVSFVNTGSDTHDTILIMAKYENGGTKLVDIIQSQSKVVPSCESETSGIVSITINTPDVEISDMNNGDVIKLFIWDKINGLKSYGVPKQIILQ